MTKALLLLVLLALMPSAFAQLPDLYKSVDRILWVVKDLENRGQSPCFPFNGLRPGTQESLPPLDMRYVTRSGIE
ncbi:MAG: hypothetical protein ABSE56_04795 [Bryobacteraceae bacterium]|jgi:hypothetical protein